MEAQTRGTVGVSFDIYRTSYLLPHRETAWPILHERLVEIVNHYKVLTSELSTPNNNLISVDENLQKLAAAFGRHVK
jgi:hypothetical protein